MTLERLPTTCFIVHVAGTSPLLCKSSLSMTWWWTPPSSFIRQKSITELPWTSLTVWNLLHVRLHPWRRRIDHYSRNIQYIPMTTFLAWGSLLRGSSPKFAQPVAATQSTAWTLPTARPFNEMDIDRVTRDDHHTWGLTPWTSLPLCDSSIWPRCGGSKTFWV